MSLLIASCINDSVILAYDAFVINNDTNELIKSLDFQKKHLCKKISIPFVPVINLNMADVYKNRGIFYINN